MELKLLVPTNRTVDGPKIRMSGPDVVIEYDYENDDGSVVWAHVRFSGTVAISYWDSSCWEVRHVSPAESLKVSDDSDWLQMILSSRDSLLDTRTQLPTLLRHYILYFDDAGAIDVAAASVLANGLDEPNS